jgi:glycosyltransferase involved in cell wall biosynthesis
MTAPAPTQLLPISVIVPAFNRSELIARALRSVQRQRTCRPSEVIVVDDASTDDTAAVARDMGATVIVHGHNQGAAAARNTAIQAATQPWLAFLDSDDEWLPDHLETLWALHDGHVLVAGAAIILDVEGRPWRYIGPLSRRPVVLESPAVLYPENFLPASATIARRDAVLAAGAYDTSLRYAEDLDLWIRVMEHGTAVACTRVVTRYRQHAGQKSQDGQKSRATQLHIVNAYRDRPWWSPKLVERQIAFRAWDALRAALRTRNVREALREAVALAPPARLGALARLLWRRHLIRRRSYRIASDGGPSVAVLPGASRDGLEEGSFVDLSESRGTLRALATLARRPAGVAIVASMAQGLAVRALGIEPRRPR